MSSEPIFGKINEKDSKRKWKRNENGKFLDNRVAFKLGEGSSIVSENGSAVVAGVTNLHKYSLSDPLDYSTKKRKLDETIQNLQCPDSPTNDVYNYQKLSRPDIRTLDNFAESDIGRSSQLEVAADHLFSNCANPADPQYINIASTQQQQTNSIEMQYKTILSNLMLSHYKNFLMNNNFGKTVICQNSSELTTVISKGTPITAMKDAKDVSSDFSTGAIGTRRGLSSSVSQVTSTSEDKTLRPHLCYLEPYSPASPALNGSPLYPEGECHSTEGSASGSPMPGQEFRLRRGKSLPEEIKNGAYWERRRRNNEAAKKSRDARRTKEDEINIRSAHLEEENFQLQLEVKSLKQEVEKLKHLLLNF